MIAAGGGTGCSRSRAADRGSASVVLIAVTVVVALLGGAGVTVAAGAGVAARAQAAADLGALAAARVARDSRAVVGQPAQDPCAIAQELVALHRARLARCDHRSTGVVHLVVEAPVTGGSLLQGWTVVRSASAGPLSEAKGPGSGSN